MTADFVSNRTIWHLKDSQDSTVSLETLLIGKGYNFGLEYALSPKISVGVKYGTFYQSSNVTLKSQPIQVWNLGSETDLSKYTIFGKYFLPISRRLQLQGNAGLTVNQTSYDKNLQSARGSSITYKPNERYVITKTFNNKKFIPGLDFGLGVEFNIFKAVTLSCEGQYYKTLSPTILQTGVYKTSKNELEQSLTNSTNSGLNFNVGLKLNTGFFYNRGENSTENPKRTKKRKPKSKK